MIVGIDAFYWDAVWNRCGRNREDSPELLIPQLVNQVKQSGKTLILGTVPMEVASTVRIDSNRTGVEGLWYAPTPSCVAAINEKMIEALEASPPTWCIHSQEPGT